MKKLMIMLAAVAMAVAAHAASYTWACESGRINAGTGETDYATMEGSTAYLMFTSIYSQDAAVAAFADGTLDTSKALASATVTSAGRISMSEFSAAVSADDNAYFVIVKDDQMYVSSSVAATYVAVGTSSITFGSQSTPSKSVVGAAADGYSAAGWYTAVPEPTSGLLMLVGLAGLALRRRRA